MKTYEEMAQSALARGKAMRNQRKKSNTILFGALPAVAAGLVLVFCIGMLVGGNGIPVVPTGPVQGSEPQLNPTQGSLDIADPTCGTDPQPIEFTIFVPNEASDGFLQLSATVEQLDPHWILQQLQDAGVITQEAAVLASVVDGNNMLTLDMNEAFLLQLRSLDSADESIVMGCLVNTFLSAYDFCECMMVTVEGNIIQTSHMDYDSPMYGITDNN